MAYLARNLKLIKNSSSKFLASQIFQRTVDSECSTLSIFNKLTFRRLSTFNYSICSFRSFGSAAAASGNSVHSIHISAAFFRWELFYFVRAFFRLYAEAYKVFVKMPLTKKYSIWEFWIIVAIYMLGYSYNFVKKI